MLNKFIRFIKNWSDEYHTLMDKLRKEGYYFCNNSWGTAFYHDKQRTNKQTTKKSKR
jgi:predicted sugar kinase